MAIDFANAYLIQLCLRLYQNLVEGVAANPPNNGAIAPVCVDGARADLHTVSRDLVRLYFGAKHLGTHGAGRSIVFYPREIAATEAWPTGTLPTFDNAGKRYRTRGQATESIWFHIWGSEKATGWFAPPAKPYHQDFTRWMDAEAIWRQIVHPTIHSTFSGAVALRDGEFQADAENGGRALTYGEQIVVRYDVLTQFVDMPVTLVQAESSEFEAGAPAFVTPGEED